MSMIGTAKMGRMQVGAVIGDSTAGIWASLERAGRGDRTPRERLS